MNTRPSLVCLTVLATSLAVHPAVKEQSAASSACSGPNGIRFNLEPRAHPVVQAAESVAFLPNGAGHGLDLVLATTTTSSTKI